MSAVKTCLCYNCFQERQDPACPCPYCGFDLEENVKKFPVALRAGTVLNDRYIVGRVLGQGGFGITYLAWDTKLEAKVAVKEFMPSEIATRIGATVSVAMESKTDEFTYGAERFQEEARTLAKFMGQPNIAGVTDYFDENDTSYFVMDYIEGISFKTYIANQGGKVTVDEALNVMIPVLRALTAVHAEGFIHRDVTPDNIYITKDGQVKLLDFGSARYSIGDKSKSLDVVLKVGYAPKEQYIRRGRQGPYTDVYSCAACFYAALTGYLPPESLERLDHDELVPVSQAGVELPEWLDKAILKGLAVQPEDRFQSAAEFLDAIESQRVVEVPGQAPAVPAKKKPPLAALIGGAAAVVVLAVGVAALSGLGGGGEPAADGGGRDNGPPLIQAEVPSITIAGETYDTNQRELNLEGRNLTDADIQDLKYMVNLVSLGLGNNQITDLTPLAGLTNLRSLGLHGNNLSDLSPLAGLTNLEELRLGGGGNGNLNEGISDLSPLSGMTQLTYLSLPPVCQVTDLSPLCSLTKLTYLNFDGSWSSGQTGKISDLSPLSTLTNLEEVSILVGSVADLSPLSTLTNLKSLSLMGTYYTPDLSPLSTLTQLERLTLYTDGIGDLSPLAGLTQLQELRLNGSEATYTSTKPLSGLTKMRILTLPSMADPELYLDLSGIAGMTELVELRFYGGVTGYAPLAKLTKLKTLSLMGTYPNSDGPGDLSAFSNLTALTSLEISLSVNATDITPLGKLTNLQSLYLHTEGDRLHPGLKDIGPLANLQNLQSLTINSRSITDLSPLRKLTNLQTADIRAYGSVEITDWSPVEHVPNLIKG
ncbi:leucine-rich repeat domain-containing protein [Dysosmobacter welbionis]|uniref:leucine-rich repeat domain-containing protein n=1 Tax=Dysosmobacter welbionis TaxID=2093857 RepID=UPI0032C00656